MSILRYGLVIEHLVVLIRKVEKSSRKKKLKFLPGAHEKLINENGTLNFVLLYVIS